MANTQGSVQITPESLAKSFVKYRKDLIVMPMYGLNKILPFLTLRTGVRYQEVVGELTGDMQLGPYHITRRDDNDVKIVGRILQTYLGSAIKGFDPNSVVESIYGSSIVQGEGLKNVPITKAVWAYLLGKLGEHLYNEMFTAVRSDNGTTTHDLFNGYQTIVKKEIHDEKMTSAIGNLHAISAITAENAVDVIEEFYDAADEKLKDQKTTLLCSNAIKRKYEYAYRTQYGHLPYNNEFKKVYLDGEDNCRLVGLGNVPDNFLMMTPKQNLLAGIATEGPGVTFECKDSLTSHFLLDFVATMFFGVQFESINKEKLLIGMTSADITAAQS